MDDNKNTNNQQDLQNQQSNEVEQDLKNRITELENNWKRALADYRNLEKRTAEEKSEFAEFANMVLIQRLLPVIDNLEMLEKHIRDTGLIMIIKEFKQILEDNGAIAMETDGKDFDSSIMDCIETAETGKENDNKVIETVTRGYKFKNKVLRPAKVRVGKAK